VRVSDTTGATEVAAPGEWAAQLRAQGCGPAAVGLPAGRAPGPIRLLHPRRRSTQNDARK
jgi:hypothetical protein